MGTKINTTYYGLESSWGTVSSWGSDCKKADSQHTFLKLAQNGDIDLENEGNIDFTAVPWGVPRCSATSYAYTLHCSMDASGTYLGTYYPVNDELDDKNNPLVLVSGAGADISYDSGGTAATNRKYQAARIIGHTDIDNNNLVSTLTADDGTTISSYSDYNESVITYLNYQTCKIVIDKVYLIDKDSTTNTVSSPNNLKIINFNELTSETIEDKWQCIGFTTKFVVNNNLSSDGTLHPAFANKHKVPIHIKNNYSGGAMKEWVQFNRNTIKSIGRPTGYNAGVSTLPKIEDINVIGNNTSYTWGVLSTTFCNVSPKKQVFDDVSYSWDMLGRFANGNVVVWYKKGTGIVASTPKVFNILKLDNNTADNIFAAILHEVAFLGFPFVINEDYVSEPIGSSYVHLPVFDYEHMITTGKYVRGTDALQFNNALWGNIFDDNIPPWDSTYVPPDTEDTNGDSGYLKNYYNQNHRLTAGGLNVWALSLNELWTLLPTINNYYIGSPDDLQLKLDFQGSNPNDYIVGFYAYPYNFTGGNATPFKIGAVTLNDSYTPYADSGFISLGTIDLTYTSSDVKWYGDFRDYPPYSTAELYIPFCGTVDIDLAYFIGHYMEIALFYDIYTGACSACIYRDSYTLYKTVNSQLGAEIPLSAARMGDYQSAVHSLQTAQKQNEIRLLSSTASLAVGAISIAAAPATGGASLLAGAGIVAGVAGLMSAETQKQDIDYKLQHIQPTIAQVSAAETQNNFCVGGNTAILFIKKARMSDDYQPTIYSKTVGNACCINNTIGDNSGLTVCSKVDTDGISKTVDGITISPTADEINAIKQAAANGIIV